MLAFITSLRHPDNAADYPRIEALLQGTLASIAQQSSDDYVVIVVGNRAPSFPLPPRTHFVPVDFAPPVAAHGPHADRSGFVHDKGTKIGIGLVAARAHQPSHVMIFDADDFLHRDVVLFVGRNPAARGWAIDKGWIYSRSRNGYRRQDGFNRTCGTSYILPFDAYGVPEDLSTSATQQELVDGFGEVLPNIMGAHRNAVQWHLDRGRVLERLPFRAAVYHVDTGENHSGKALPGIVRPWNRRLGDLFAIRPTRGPLATLWAAIGPRALAQSAVSFGRRVVKGVSARAKRLTSAARG
ncbi:hypothetical protein [Microbacterium marinilacus]|uniref:Glycosyltransferase family A protein n=1 Tax=Microbacterium marinilacus TaxID=415209 RepID=A0ABP7BDN9_9MICO|nr:hypothetical protein [Microbacterium marinilacus]MBY0689448.1 hypothetical protein [Microbacterium marinilacus]